MMIDYAVRPTLPDDQLAQITNTLACWLPATADGTAVSLWNEAQWRAAAWVAYWQNALPWLVQRIREADISPPEPLAAHLLQLDEASRARTQTMLDSCVKLLAELDRAGIPALLLKGAALAPLYYDDPLQRPLADLDILIHKQNLPAARRILQQLGYTFYSRSAEDEVYLRGARQQNIWAPDNVQPVEMHYTLREEYAGIGYNLADVMWAHSERRPYWQGAQARIPQPAVLLLHVCAHASSDWLIQRGRLMHIQDIQTLCSHMQPGDWQTFAQLIRPHSARFVYPALALVGKYTHLPISESALNSLRENCPPTLLAWLDETSLADASESNPASRSGIGFEIARRLARSRLEIGRFWLRSFFPRRYNLAKRYPQLVETPFWPLGYVLINVDRIKYMAKKLRST